MNDLEEFRSLGLSEVTLEALREKGFVTPTDIQRECIPLLLQHETDVVGQAQTGTGKTAAFGLPILEELDEKNKQTQAIILAPTRELAMQVASEIKSLAGKRKITIEAIYGGTSYEPQLKKLKKGIQIVVGTPGRILDHIDRGSLDLSHIHFAVLDEADEMLDMGFIEDIEKILSKAPKEKRMLLFSATMPAEILRLAENFMREFEIVRIKKQENEEVLTEQFYYELRESDKMEALTRIIDMDKEFYGVVFCRTKLQAEEIGRKLSDRGYLAEALHGDLSQKQREIILSKMKDHRINILVATDVAARGIDIQELTHVVNYTIPQDGEAYIHRVGRTGRAGKKGTAITFITSSEYRKLNFIRKISKFDINRAELPTPEKIVQAKRDRITESINEKLKEDKAEEYTLLASDLLSSAEPTEVISTLLSMLYKNELDPRRYVAIRSLNERKEKKSRSEDNSSRKREKDSDNKAKNKDIASPTVRLFIARGRHDGFTKRTLANTLIEECRVRDEDLMDIQVMEDFSFINVPSYLADGIIRSFKDAGEDGKPLIVRAKPEKDARPSKAKSRRGNDEGNPRRARSRRRWEDEVQYYGRDTRDDEDFFSKKSKAPSSRKKSHGKYNKKR